MTAARPVRATRSAGNPLIHPGLSASLGDNINGPSLIGVPDRLPDPLGRYYLYFAHHDGRRIRLAYSDRIDGPWRIYEPGVLPLRQSRFRGHIASPDVHVDHATGKIRLYYHGSDAGTDVDAPQYTRLALSDNGIDFRAREERLGKPYMRVFRLRGRWYALAMPGVLYRSTDGLGGFERGPALFSPRMRHAAVRVVADDRLQVFFSNVGDCPESILCSEVAAGGDWGRWSAGPPVRVLAPEYYYEGVGAPRVPSRRGIARGPVHELRDPAIFEERGTVYLLYSVAGEQGIAVARLSL